MKKITSRWLIPFVFAFPLVAGAAPVPSHYLFVWAMEAKHPDASTLSLMSPNETEWRRIQGSGKDFLAVFDIRPGASFGTLVATLPVGDAVMAHHTNYAEPANDLLYANDWIANRTYVFDLSDPQHPRSLGNSAMSAFTVIRIPLFIYLMAIRWQLFSIPADSTTPREAWWSSIRLVG